MKKIYCKYVPDDYLHVTMGGDDVWVDIKQENTVATFALSPDQIRKLRKQLKRALVKIEGESSETKRCDCDICVEPKKAQDEEYKPGDLVYLLPWDNECPLSSVAARDIDFGRPVVLSELNDSIGLWSFEYTKLDGITQSTGFAYEKSFGRRA